jgi:alpha-aminoadipate carrier protein LysW
MTTQTIQPRCPQCDEQVPMDEEAFVNELVSCPSCRTELEIVAVGPPELALAPEVEEDWGE